MLCGYVLYMLPMIFKTVVHVVNEVEQTKRWHLSIRLHEAKCAEIFASFKENV